MNYNCECKRFAEFCESWRARTRTCEWPWGLLHSHPPDHCSWPLLLTICCCRARPGSLRVPPTPAPRTSLFLRLHCPEMVHAAGRNQPQPCPWPVLAHREPSPGAGALRSVPPKEGRSDVLHQSETTARWRLHRDSQRGGGTRSEAEDLYLSLKPQSANC